MRDQITEEFLSKLKCAAANLSREDLKVMDAGFAEKQSEIAAGLSETIKKGLDRYQKRKAEGIVGPLNFIYFSFLRTSILYGSPNYRVDFYDAQDRCSLTECAVPWNFHYVFDLFEHLKKELRRIHSSPNRVPGYELDLILYQKAELYRKAAKAKLESALRLMLENQGKQLLEGEQVKFYIGEFLDEAALMLEWDQDRIREPEADVVEKPEEDEDVQG